MQSRTGAQSGKARTREWCCLLAFNVLTVESVLAHRNSDQFLTNLPAVAAGVAAES